MLLIEVHWHHDPIEVINLISSDASGVPDDQNHLEDAEDLLNKSAQLVLDKLTENLPYMLADHERSDQKFRERNHERWRDGFGLLKMFLVASQEMGATIAQRESEYFRRTRS